MGTDHGQVFAGRRNLGPQGLCGNRRPHDAHLHESATLGRFWCTADEADREPGRSQRRADAAWRCPVHGPGQPCNSMCGLLPR